MRHDSLARVSRETRDRLDIYVRELTRWQRAVNLVSPASLADVWTRHIADSLQLASLEPSATRWVDLGSGAGLPGLVIAADDPVRAVTLVESDGRKCAFLRHAAREMDVAPTIVEGRIEAFIRGAEAAPDIVVARGLAPLSKLLDYAQPLLEAGATGLFPKGMDHDRELTAATECWIFDVDVIASTTDSKGRILRITKFRGRRS